ncbi:MAG: 1-acyl-sn-glycerol-3-phosphate acyltransferase, partial [Prevotellaceae bacterium]|nr:1-acyl-sn-glycerol-3-phosphate acyltransferase [Prevotellaceae bacterium]
MFEDIRPYFDGEIGAVFEKLLANRVFMQAAEKIMPKELIDEFRQNYLKITTIDAFQKAFMLPMLEIFLQKKSCELTFSGIKNIVPSALFISNHRDIITDPAFLQYILAKNNFRTSQIAIGNNLAAADWILAFMKLNKSFIIKRNLSRGEQITAFKELSAYIRHAVTEQKAAIWIAQREGRAKDSNDRTQASILKMFALSGNGSLIENLKTLNICPLSISYEYDACDFLKVKEMQQNRDNEHFIKTIEDDILSMHTGIFGYIGHLHYAFTPCINAELDIIEQKNLPRNEQIEQIISLIDKQIHLAYKIYPINYFAFDTLYKTKKYSDFYTKNNAENFQHYFLCKNLNIFLFCIE